MTDVIGVIGGIGSGKSAVAQAFARAGAVVLDADALAHDALLAKDTKDALGKIFGVGIFAEDGTVDRKALADLVFGPGKEEALERLNNLIHPIVRKNLDRGLQEARDAGAKMVVLDIPLLMNSPFKTECDHILFVEVSKRTRLERVQSRGWSEEELLRRESSQLSLAEKRAAADLILENEGGTNELDLKVKKLFHQLVGS